MMNKADFIAALAERVPNATKADAERFLAAMQDLIIEEVAKGNEVRLTGFAAFTPVERAARTMRNPQTQEPIQVPAAKNVRIRPLKRFVDTVRG